MKKLRFFFGGIICVLGMLLVVIWNLNRQEQTQSGNHPSRVLTIYNWGDYIDPALITKFEKQTGYKVDYETFDSNESMYTKIKQGGTAYDIAVPSDYMLRKMVKAQLVRKLDKRKLVGLNNIDSSFLNLAFDPHNQYSVPYFWGTLGIIYNDKVYKKSQVDSWNKLWNPRFKNQIMFVDGAREFMGIGLQSLGDSLNTKNAAQLEQAYSKLKRLTQNAKAIVSDEIKMYMVNEEAKLAVTYSGEAADMMDQNSHLHYVLPSEGTNLWFDNLVIPKTAKNVKGAYAFINFMLEPKNAAQNARYIGYATPNKKAKALLGKQLTANHAFYPSNAQLKKMQVYTDLGPTWLQRYNDLYLELKMYHK